MSHAKRSRAAAVKPSIVLVDDEPDFRLAVERWLEPWFRVTGLPDGEDLLETLSEIETDVLILDVHLPGADGFSLCRAVRSDSRFSDLPILFLTGSREDPDFFRNIEAGGTVYVTKPFGHRTFLTQLRKLCGARQAA